MTLSAPHKVLVATNDTALSMVVSRTALERMHFETDRVHDDKEMLQSIRSETPDILILDAALPQSGGLEACRKLRGNPATSAIPIVMVTAENNPLEEIEALESGADDCVAKPLTMDVLAAHIKALSRRALSSEEDIHLHAGPIDMDIDRWMVSISGDPVDLTKKEFRLLQELVEAKGRVLTRDFLLQTVWSHSTIHGLDTRTIDVHIGRLRRKLGAAGRYIITVRNVGFRFDVLPEWIIGTDMPPSSVSIRSNSALT